MLDIKKGAQPPILYLMAAAANVSERLGMDLTITSGIDGRHDGWSGHYQSRAIDVRTHGLDDPVRIAHLLADEAQRLMQVEDGRIYCDVHSAGTPNSHIHLQFK